MNYLTLSFLLLLGCSNSPKRDHISIQKNNSVINIFVNEKINLDSCIIVEDPGNRSNLSIIRKDSKYGLINKKNKQLVLPIEYDTIERPQLADYFFISKNSLSGVVTCNGFLTVPILYEHIEYDWKENKSGADCFIVQKNKKLGSIDFYNNTIIPIEFDGISNWVEYGPDAHYVKRGGKYGIVDYNTGKLIVPVEYDGIEDHRGLIEVKNNKQYGILSWGNEVIIPCKYDKLFFDLDYWGFEKNHKDRIIAQKDNIWYEFLLSGEINKANISTKEIDKDFLKYKPDNNEYRYHLKDCMVFPK